MPLRVSASQCETHQRMHWENKFYQQLWYSHRHSISQPHPFQKQISILSRLVLVTSRSWVVVDGCCLFLSVMTSPPRICPLSRVRGVQCNSLCVPPNIAIGRHNVLFRPLHVSTLPSMCPMSPAQQRQLLSSHV
jgi:hypothetical protein